MKFLSRRPLAAGIAVSLLFAVAASRLASLRLPLAILAIALALSVRYLLKGKPRVEVCLTDARSFAALSLALTLALLASQAIFDFVSLRRFEARVGSSARVEAVVVEMRYESTFASAADVSLISIDGEPVKGRGLLDIDGPSGLSPGDVVTLEAEFLPLDEVLSDYGLGREALLADGTRFALSTDFAELIGTKSTLSVAVAELRAHLSAAIGALLDRESAELSRALILADSDGLGVIKRDFRRIGASHLLALSGMQLTLLCGLSERLLEKMRVRRSLRMIAAILLVVFYLALTGAPASLLRAAVMLTLLNLSRLSGRDRDSVSALFLTVWLVFLFDQTAIYDVGFLLSAAATLGILLAARATAKAARKIKAKPLKLLFKAVAVTAAAQIFLMPLQYIFFGETSLLSVLSTLLLATPTELLFVLLIPYMLCSATGVYTLAGVLAIPIGALAQLSIHIAEALARADSLVSLEYHFTPIIILGCAAALAVMSAKNVEAMLPRVVALVISGSVFFVSSAIYEANDSERLFAYGDGRNDALAYVSSGECVLVDVTEGSPRLLRSFVRELHAERVCEVDTLVFTHLHRRHALTLRKLSEQMLVRRLVLPEAVDEYDRLVLADLEELASELGVEVVSYPRPEAVKLTLGSLSLTIGEETYISRSTHPLISLVFEVAGERAAYLGSAVCEYLPLPECDTALVGSHGPLPKAELPPDARIRELRPGEPARLLPRG